LVIHDSNVPILSLSPVDRLRRLRLTQCAATLTPPAIAHLPSDLGRRCHLITSWHPTSGMLLDLTQQGKGKKITLLCLSISSPRLLSASNSMANRLGLTSPLHLILLPMRSMCSCIESISTPFTAIVVDTGLDPFVPRESPPSAPFVGIANNEGCVDSMLNA
jgi:hypothetical protein